jgi:hypothetical protein
MEKRHVIGGRSRTEQAFPRSEKVESSDGLSIAPVGVGTNSKRMDKSVRRDRRKGFRDTGDGAS